MKSTLAKTITDGAICHWCTLALEFTFTFCYHSYYPYLQFVINFPPVAMSREVGYSPVDLQFLNKMCNCSHRNFKLLGGCLIAFTFNKLVYILFLLSWDNSLLGFLWSMFSVVHTMSPNSTMTPCQPLNRRLTDYKFKDTCSANWRTHLGWTCPYGQIIFNVF